MVKNYLLKIIKNKEKVVVVVFGIQILTHYKTTF